MSLKGRLITWVDYLRSTPRGGTILLAILSLSVVVGAQSAWGDTGHAPQKPSFSRDPVLTALSSRDASPSVEELKKIAGGEDHLVRRVLELRTGAELSYVQIRSAKVLVRFSDRPNVQQAIFDDIEAPGRLGLVRVYARFIDSLSGESFRRGVSARIVARAVRDPNYQSAVELLRSSTDPAVLANLPK